MADLRLLLNDKSLTRLPFSDKGQYLARDTELKGFFVVIGRRKKTFTVQGDMRRAGKRATTVRIAIGETSELSTRTARTLAKDYLSQISRGVHPKAETAKKPSKRSSAAPQFPTLQEAWERYRDAHMIRKGRSERTIESYRDHVERIFADWRDTSLDLLGHEPNRIIDKHDAVTNDHGPYIANGSMRTLRAIYNHARKANRGLAENPVDAIDWNEEKRRDTAMGMSDLLGWFQELSVLENPIRREFHLMSLLSGSRPTALKETKPEHIDWRQRILHIPRPKGGAKKAFDIPLSREMIRSLIRAIRLGQKIYPAQAKHWLFPADSEEGHLSETKEDREELSKWGNDLRQTYRTLAAIAGISSLDAHLLMNHALREVNTGYITRHKLLSDHLRGQQQAISSIIFSAIPKKRPPATTWLFKARIAEI